MKPSVWLKRFLPSVGFEPRTSNDDDERVLMTGYAEFHFYDDDGKMIMTGCVQFHIYDNDVLGG